jgi:hypothetical protein
MIKRKATKKSSPQKKRAKSTVSGSLLDAHADQLREIVHRALESAGVHNLSLRSMQFAAIPTCPDGQHAEKTCTRDANGTETCTWNCVPN